MAATISVPQITQSEFSKFLQDSIVRRGYSTTIASETTLKSVCPVVEKIFNVGIKSVSLRLCFPKYESARPDLWKVLPCKVYSICHLSAAASRVEICYCDCFRPKPEVFRLKDGGIVVPLNLQNFLPCCDCPKEPVSLPEQSFKEQSGESDVFTASLTTSQPGSSFSSVSSESVTPLPSLTSAAATTARPVPESPLSSPVIPNLQLNSLASSATALKPLAESVVVATSSAAVVTASALQLGDSTPPATNSGAAAAGRSSVDHQNMKASYKRQQRERLASIRSDNSKSSFDSTERLSYSEVSTATATATVTSASAVTAPPRSSNSQNSQGQSPIVIKETNPTVKPKKSKCSIG